MKLIVQIPCLNEEKTLPLVLKSIPKKIKGINKIEILIIDDGSTDKTIEIAKKHGVKHVVQHTKRMGLARSFRDGIDECLRLGADIIVNTDGDNQYPQNRIGDLIKPILDKKADIVVADRQTHKIEHFSPLKKALQKIGSKVVNMAAGTNLPDAASGFRAYSRSAAIRLNIITPFSYAMETIIQAGNKRIAMTSIPVDTNPKLRESRLFKNSLEHVYKSSVAIIRAYIMYRPYVVFVTLGTILLIAGFIPFIRYAYLVAHHNKGNHVQSLIVGSIMLIGALISYSLGIISDLTRTNRILQEEILEQIRTAKYSR